ncbi:MAG: tetratricopeptide repeat protein [Tepidisphaera sp.]|nr:tetratricopeptide repeat protein [Tepidisphaera sp.]
MSMPPTVARAIDAHRRGDNPQAETLLRRHLQHAPGDAAAISMLAQVLQSQEKHEQALYFRQRAVELRPKSGADRAELGMLLHRMGRRDEALAQFELGQTLAPSIATNFTGAGIIAAERGDHPRAAALFRSAMAADPSVPWPAFNLATMQIGSGHAELAAETAREAIARGADPRPLLRILTQFVNYATDDPGALSQIMAAAGRLSQEGVPPPARFSNAADPERPLRVGLLTTDLRFHAVIHFIEHLIERLPALGLSLYAYQLDARVDDVTDRIKPRFAGWRDAWTLRPEALHEAIRQDGIDVLIDMVGWLEGQRISVLARKPAPVIVSYCGFPNSTGLTTIDARFVDSITDPPGGEGLYPERLVRLDPCFVCYRPSPHAEAPHARPQGGELTFGSFNSIWKITRATAALWGRVLSEVPGSRLVLKASNGEASPLRDWLPQAMQVEPSRLTLLPFARTPAEHLAAYHDIDIALDTFPYNGATTTCEALMMGVPVVSLAGRSHASRVGASLLRAAGLGELAATSPEAFVSIAAGIAGDAAKRERWRHDLPAMLRASSLCDESAHAARFAGAIRTLWREWCRARAQQA